MKRFGHNPFLVFALSLLTANFCAAVFITVLYYSLPPTDSAYGQGLFNTFHDPFVLFGGCFIATIFGVVGFVCALFCLRTRNLLRCMAFIVGTATISLLILTPLIEYGAALMAFLIGIVSLIYCSNSQRPFFQPRKSNQSV